jgi:hypothetical protein
VPVFLLDKRVPGRESEDLIAALSDLAAYSLVSFDGAKSRFSVHRLVQLVVRRDLRHREQSQQRVAEALVWIDAAFDGDPQDRWNWPRLDALWPHALAIAKRATQIDSATGLTNKLALLLTTKISHAGRDIQLGISPRNWLSPMTELKFRHAKFEKALEPLRGLTNLTELKLTGRCEERTRSVGTQDANTTPVPRPQRHAGHRDLGTFGARQSEGIESRRLRGNKRKFTCPPD